MECLWCHAPIRERTVLVGRAPGRPVRMFIDQEPHDDGRVIERDDGKFRLLAVEQNLHRDPRKKVYRIHSRSSCDPARKEKGRDVWKDPPRGRERDEWLDPAEK